VERAIDPEIERRPISRELPLVSFPRAEDMNLSIDLELDP
jgi:hypothetical protein